jgi:tellurite resistance protein TehA-like permease
MESSRWNLRSAVQCLDPGCFGLVMATGIVSRAMVLDGATRLAGILLGISIVAYLVLAAAMVWRLAGFTREVRADARDPRRAFGFFTVPAASNVLAARLAGDGHSLAAAVLIGIGTAGWVLLGYAILTSRHWPMIPAAMARRHRR